MAEFLENNENIIREELMVYYNFRTNLFAHINKRIEEINQIQNKGSEYDYCEVNGQLKELTSLLEFIKHTGRNTLLTKQFESTNKEN